MKALKDLLAVILLASAILAPHFLLKPPPPQIILIESTFDPQELHLRIDQIDQQLEKALAPYNLPLVKTGGKRKPTVRNIIARP